MKVMLDVKPWELEPTDTIADKAAKLIARDYGEVLKRLEEE